MKLNIFASTQQDGIMSDDKIFFPNLTKEERALLIETTRDNFFKKRNLEYNQALIISEKNSQMKSRVATETQKIIKEKIIILKSNTPNLPVAVLTEDDPIIVASVNIDDHTSVAAIALGTLSNLDQNILHEMIESLIKETDTAPFEMTFYIGACPSKENYLIDSKEQLTNSYIWKDAIIKQKKKYVVDIRYAIFNQLISEIVDPNYIYFDSTNTEADNRYFSKYGKQQGMNLIGVVYTDEEI